MSLIRKSFSPQNVKIRITTFIDEDALQKFKEIAAARKIKYQTLLNQVIRGFVSGKNSKPSSKGGLTEENVRQIVHEELRKRA